MEVPNDTYSGRNSICVWGRVACSEFKSDFEWKNDKEKNRVTDDPDNKGYTGPEIRDMARDWICERGEKVIACVPERRAPYKEFRHFHDDIVISNLKAFTSKWNSARQTKMITRPLTS
jgi:hypothetical protein